MDKIYLSAITGLSSAIAQLYLNGSPVGLPITFTEIASTGEYIATVPNTVAYGRYLVVVSVGDLKLGSEELYWDGSRIIDPIKYEELHRIEGLNPDHPMTVTPIEREAGDIHMDITGDGVTNSTVTRT